MEAAYSILHISDLHRSPRDPISNSQLISSLIQDRENYSDEHTKIRPPDAIVVSGDLIQGALLDDPEFDTKIREQYDTAYEFLSELADRFVEGDRTRVVIVPGNHDVDWNAAFSAMAEVPVDEYPSDLSRLLQREDTSYRWDWKTRKLYRIIDEVRYESRFDQFWEFFDRFYGGTSGLRVRPKSPTNLYSLFDDRIVVAAFNSCWKNDCFAFHGSIERSLVGRSYLDINDIGTPFDLRLAVWHHSVQGGPFDGDYMDIEVVRGMIGRGFRLGLHGHQHKVEAYPQQIFLPNMEKMALVSAGSLCAGPEAIPVGYRRQYNVVELDDELCRARVHVRSMNAADLFGPGSLIEYNGKSYADLSWDKPKTPVGSKADTREQRRAYTVERALSAYRDGDASRAVEILMSIDLPAESYERTLFFECAMDSGGWEAIVVIAAPPVDTSELIHLIEAHIHMRDASKARMAIKEYGANLELPTNYIKSVEPRITYLENISNG